MAVQFLSPAWMDAILAALRGSDEYLRAIRGTQMTLVNSVTQPDGSEIIYWIKVANDRPDGGFGALGQYDALMRTDYDTARALNLGETTAPAAMMQGRVTVQGNMLKLMQLQNQFQAYEQATRSIEVVY